MSDFKLDVVIRPDSEEPATSSPNGKAAFSENNNGLYGIADGIQKQGYMPISNIATNTERTGLSDR